MATFTGHVLLPAFAGAEIGDDIPQRKLVVTKDDGSEVFNQTFDSTTTEQTFGPVNLNDHLTLSLWDVDAAGNLSVTPSVLAATVQDVTPPATPGELNVSFSQDAAPPADNPS